MASPDVSNHRNRKKRPLIVSLSSGKGGVGKTTLGLAMSREWILTSQGRAVMLDADLIGSELVDILWHDSEQRFEISLLRLLTQAAGGQTTFDDLLCRWLKEHPLSQYGYVPDPSWDNSHPHPGIPAIPLIHNPTSGNNPTHVTVIPTLGSTDVKERQREREGLALRFVSDDFGRGQIEWRLGVLLGRLLTEWKADLIVIDGSPFHVGLGRALEHIFNELPFGLPDKAREALQQAQWAWLEILGGEPTEIARLGHLMKEKDEKFPAHRARGWILNRDQHRYKAGEQERCWDCIPFELAFKKPGAKAPPGTFMTRNLLHMSYSWRYSLQTGLHLLEKGAEGSKIAYDVSRPADWVAMWKGLSGEMEKFVPLIWDEKAKDFKSVSFTDYLRGLFS